MFSRKPGTTGTALVVMNGGNLSVPNIPLEKSLAPRTALWAALALLPGALKEFNAMEKEAKLGTGDFGLTTETVTKLLAENNFGEIEQKSAGIQHHVTGSQSFYNALLSNGRVRTNFVYQAFSSLNSAVQAMAELQNDRLGLAAMLADRAMVSALGSAEAAGQKEPFIESIARTRRAIQNGEKKTEPYALEF